MMSALPSLCFPPYVAIEFSSSNEPGKNEAYVFNTLLSTEEVFLV